MFKKRWKRKPASPDDEPREIKDVKKAREKTLNRAFNILSVKPYSVAEMRRRLLEKNWTNAEIVDSVLETLKEYNYLNDAQYAENLAAYTIRQKPQGRRKLQLKLAQKRIDKDTAKEALEKVFEDTPESDLIDEALEKRLRIKGVPQDRDETKKLFDYLLRQGFSFDLVREKVRDIAQRDLEQDGQD